MKKVLRLQGALMVLLLGFILVGCGNKTESQLSYVTIETNPSVELVVNEKGVVVAVNGTNEDGKLLLQDEKIEGLKIEAATEKIVTLTEELGYTFKGSVKADSQGIEISVTSNTVELAKQIESKVQGEIEATIEELKLSLKLEIENSKGREFLEEIVMAYDPTLTREEVKAMTMQELLTKVKDATKEKAQFISVKLEEYYETLKAYEFKIYYKQEIATALENGYTQFLESYKSLLTSFSDAINSLKEFEVYTFTNPESSYVKAMEAYQKAKQDLASKKIQFSVSDGSNSIILEAQITVSKKALEAADKVVETVDATIKASFDTLIKSLETIYNSLEELEKQFPQELKLEEKLTNAENYINTNKKALFEKFEESISKETLDQMEKDLKARKAELKAMVVKSKK